MKHRIRAAGLLVDDQQRILLVKHRDYSGEWWVPPGGGLESSDASTQEAAKREIFEETGLTAEVGALLYVREFSEPRRDTHHLELFFLITHFSGTVTIDNLRGLGGDEFMVEGAQWLTQEELHDIVVYPEELRDDFWKRLDTQDFCAHYLGVHQETA